MYLHIFYALMKNPNPARKALQDPVVGLLRAVRAVATLYDGEFPPGGPGATQFTLLVMLSGQSAVAERQLSRALAIDKSALARDLALLARRGLIEAAPGSRRAIRRWRLTEAGHTEIARLRPNWERAQARLMRTIGRKDWKALLSILDRVSAATP